MIAKNKVALAVELGILFILASISITGDGSVTGRCGNVGRRGLVVGVGRRGLVGVGLGDIGFGVG